MTVEADLAEKCRKRVSEQSGRTGAYMDYRLAYGATDSSGGPVRGSFGDGRPALQELEGFHDSLGKRQGAPNLVRSIIDDRVALMCELPVITFDPEGNETEDLQQATLVSRAVRGQWELSQMSERWVKAETFSNMYGETCYTLDPLRPADIKAGGNPFRAPGVYINIHDPSCAFPRFGTGDQAGRVQDLFLYYGELTRDEVEGYAQGEIKKLRAGAQKYEVIIFYSDQEKTILISDGDNAEEIYRDDHKYGFCPAEWGRNKLGVSDFGVSELDQTLELHRTTQKLFHLAMDGAIMATFPPIHVHQPEHVGRMSYGPLSIIETVEDGAVQPLSSNVNISVPAQLHDMARNDLLSQTGSSPLRQSQAINHANTSGRAIDNIQAPGLARINMTNILQGTALEWLNAKIARILYQDRAFKNLEMTVYGIKEKGSSKAVTFTGDQLGGLWRNHVQWTSDSGNKHETLVMYLQLHKDGLVSGRKVLEAIGEEDPERLIEEAKLDQQQQQQLMAAMQQGQALGGPPVGPPTGPAAAAQNVALGAGSLQGSPVQAPPGMVQQGPPGEGMPGFSPIAGSPGGPPGAAAPVPDVDMEVKMAAASLNLHGEIVSATTKPNGAGMPESLLVFITSYKDVAMLKTALRQLAQTLLGPDAKVRIQVVGAESLMRPVGGATNGNAATNQ